MASFPILGVVALLAASLSSSISDSPFDATPTFQARPPVAADGAPATPTEKDPTVVTITVTDAVTGAGVSDCDVFDTVTDRAWTTDDRGIPVGQVNGRTTTLGKQLAAHVGTEPSGTVTTQCGLRQVSLHYVLEEHHENVAVLPVVQVGSLFGSSGLSS